MSMVKIAAGHNNTSGLKKLELLSAGLFREYGGNIESVLTNWNDVDAQEMDGAQNYIDIGLPSFTWTLFRLTRAEFTYLASNFYDEVTVYQLDQQGNAYANYNAQLKPIRAGKDSGTWAADAIGGWENVKLEFYNAEAI